MKIAVIYNRDSKSVINLFGIPNREKYGQKSIQRIVTGLKAFGHQVEAFEGDKDLIGRLEEYMPRVLKGERPGLAFNLSYGIQGQARYTHVPGILEMIGIPYVGSNPLAHSLSLDKVVAKMIFRQNGLPTPDFAVLKDAGFDPPDLEYPLIVKPKNEAVSMGIKIVTTFEELQEAARVILDNFNQPVLVERYIEGREINVGLLGNNPPEALPPCEIVFGGKGPAIYTIEDKKGKSGRTIDWICPAPLGDELSQEARRLAVEAFTALGCYDVARVDMRLDDQGRLFILEINSLPSLGEHGSYTIAAQHIGLDFSALVNRIVEVASARYFGTPSPPTMQMKEKDPQKNIFVYITGRRDQIEHDLEDWTRVSSLTSDPVGNKMAVSRLDKKLTSLKMSAVPEFTDERSVWTWQSNSGFAGGTLLIGHIDVPLELSGLYESFRREPEWLYGTGIGTSRAPLVVMEYALRSLRSCRLLHNRPIGVLYYSDEGRDCRYSAKLIRAAASQASQVLVLRPGGLNGQIFLQRRGQRKHQVMVEGNPRRLGQKIRGKEPLLWVSEKLLEISQYCARTPRLDVTVAEIQSEHFPLLVPHRINMKLLMSYLDPRVADEAETQIRAILSGGRFQTSLELVSDRPQMKERRIDRKLAEALVEVASVWEIPLPLDSSLWPSAGGLAPARIPTVCGLGPASRNLYIPQEAVNRTGLIQRTLLLAQFLLKNPRSQ
jgi:D-alanine-D-alanine ligase